MFVDREEELSLLQNLYASGRPQLVLIYGRRRVGKTWLVKRFLEGRRGLYFYAQRRPLADELARLAEALSEALGRYVKPQWDSVFAALRDAGRFVLALDEFGHWLDVDPGVLSILQRGWDEYLADSQVFLILLTSAHAVAERAVAYGGGLFGRRTAQIRLGPPAPRYAADFCRPTEPPSLQWPTPSPTACRTTSPCSTGVGGLRRTWRFSSRGGAPSTRRPRTSSATRCGSPTSISTS